MSNSNATIQISIDHLEEFKNHPFTIRNDQDMDFLIQSVRKHGILEPILVRPQADGLYEIISGNRRYRAAKVCNLAEIPAVVSECSDDEATIQMVDANLHRESIDFRSQCRSTLMKRDAMKHQGKKSEKHTDEILAAERNVKPETIRRMCRLGLLIDELFDPIEEHKIGRTNAVNLSYLTREQQHTLYEIIIDSGIEWEVINSKCGDIRKYVASGGSLTEDKLIQLIDITMEKSSSSKNEIPKKTEPTEHKQGSTIAVDVAVLQFLWGDEESSADKILKRIYLGALMTSKFPEQYQSVYMSNFISTEEESK